MDIEDLHYDYYDDDDEDDDKHKSKFNSKYNRVKRQKKLTKEERRQQVRENKWLRQLDNTFAENETEGYYNGVMQAEKRHEFQKTRSSLSSFSINHNIYSSVEDVLKVWHIHENCYPLNAKLNTEASYSIVKTTLDFRFNYIGYLSRYRILDLKCPFKKDSLHQSSGAGSDGAVHEKSRSLQMIERMASTKFGTKYIVCSECFFWSLDDLEANIMKYINEVLVDYIVETYQHNRIRGGAYMMVCCKEFNRKMKRAEYMVEEIFNNEFNIGRKYRIVLDHNDHQSISLIVNC